MVGARFGDGVGGGAHLKGGAEFLQRRLPVEPGTQPVGGFDQFVEQGVHEGVGRVTSGRKKQGAQQCLERVGQNRGLVGAAAGQFALAELQQGADLEPAGHIGQGVGVHHRGPQLCEPSFGVVGEAPVQVVGDHQAQYGVTEKLEALVVRNRPVLVAVAAVHQGKLEKLGIDGDPQLVELVMNAAHGRRCQGSRI